jgi:hypothetical protein
MTADGQVRADTRTYTDGQHLDAALAGDSPTVHVEHGDGESRHPKGFAESDDPPPLELDTPYVRRDKSSGE